MSTAKRITRAERIQQWYRTLSADGQLPADWTAYVCGDLALAFEQADAGISIRSLYDLRLRLEFLAPAPAPLFELTLFNGDADLLIDASSGWGQTALRKVPDGFTLQWSNPLDERLGPLRVRLHATINAGLHALDWAMHVTNHPSPCSVRRAIFPQVTLRKFDDNAVLFVPSGPGELKRGAWDEAWRYDQPYGQAWCSMQYMAAYAQGPKPCGLYMGVHDPFGSTKDLRAFSDPAAHTVTLHFDTPAPELLRPGNGFQFSGTACWQLLHGDWYDAAQYYRGWCMSNARWMPARTRRDTPMWMREVGVWLQVTYTDDMNLLAIHRFREYMGVTIAIHWYQWHQIPFDNDYPHYFPAKVGYAQTIAELREYQIYSMPYINGRLWDTHDRGSIDYEFTRVALPAATKDADGNPFTERYGSIEADGTPVTLAVMCPTTELWQERVREVTLRLINEIGADAVYIDQVAAAKPTLCADPSHGHPLGGGHWWNEGYWDMIDRIRQSLPPGRALTTECNAEGFIRQFDGYLTWHWQHDNMAPAFMAVYGAMIQAFGRSYQGNTLAQRMKAGQQLVFGEQIGWFAPNIIDQPELAQFVRRVVRLRVALQRYFNAGEMLRPPTLGGEIPRVKADWQWYGECWVTTDAVLTGAWALHGEHRMVLIFANVSDAEVVATVRFNSRDYFDIDFDTARLSVIEADTKPNHPETVGNRFKRTITFAAQNAVALELVW